MSISVANEDLNAPGRNSHQNQHSCEWLVASMKKKICITAMFQHITFEPLPRSPSALNGCAKIRTCPQMATSTVGTHIGAILHCWKMRCNSPGGILYFLKQKFILQKTIESLRSPSAQFMVSCFLIGFLVFLNHNHLFSEISATYLGMCAISLRAFILRCAHHTLPGSLHWIKYVGLGMYILKSASLVKSNYSRSFFILMTTSWHLHVHTQTKIILLYSLWYLNVLLWYPFLPSEFLSLKLSLGFSRVW